MVRKKQMSERELANDLYAHRHDAGEWSEEEEHIEVRPARTAVISCRIPLEELDALEQAAQDAGESLSEFVRQAVKMLIGVRTPPAPRIAVASSSTTEGHPSSVAQPYREEESTAPYTTMLPA